MDPGNQGQAPVGGVEADEARAQVIEGGRRGKQGLGKGGVVAIGGREAKEEGQARGAAEQGMDAVAMQETGAMVRGGGPVLGIAVAPPPGFDRGAINNEV